MFDDVASAAGASAATAAGVPPRPMVPRVSRWRLVAALQVAEVLAVAISSYYWLRHISTATGGRAGLVELLGFALTVALVVHFVLRALNAHDFATILNVWRSSTTAAFAWILSTAPVLSWSIGPGSYGDLWLISAQDWLWGGACIVLVRFVAGYAGAALLWMRWLRHNVLVVGSGAEAQLCTQYLRSDQSGANVVGIIAAEEIAELQSLIQTSHVNDIIVATAERDREQLRDLIRRLLCLPVRVLLWPQSVGVEAEWVATSGCKAGGMPLLLASTPPLDGWRWVLKDVQDRSLALLLLIILLPALLGIAVLVRVSSPGPVLFRQEREGYNGREFVILKFRTMHVAPRKLDLVLTARRDARIFPLGRILRRTSLDELPQLLNVLRGDMWLVGPRPHSPLATAAGQCYAAAVKQYMGRFRVKPGITGLAQVNGWRGTTNTIEEIQQRVAYDLYYIEHWSVLLDVQIVVQTAVKGFVHRNAY
jgi:exopolysaccharide biosynthesis polyprenyl glycosylphosphotransferase